MAVRALFQQAPWRVDPFAINDSRFPPGCLGSSESAMLYHLAKVHYRGTGFIVDCGAFLGKSAALLAQGAADNPVTRTRRGPVVHSYDWFRVCDDHDVGFIKDVSGLSLSIGDSSRAIFDRATARWSHLIEAHEGNFLEADWPGHEIEILFVDICKTPELNARVIDVMFPSLVPGHAIVVQQDYHHAHHPVVHMSLELLAESIEPLSTRVDDSFVFMLNRRVPDALLQTVAHVHELPAERQLALMDGAIARLPGDQQHFVQLARAVLVAGLHGRQAGLAAMPASPRLLDGAERLKWDHELAEVRWRITIGPEFG